jgi:hypothetical protein
MQTLRPIAATPLRATRTRKLGRVLAGSVLLGLAVLCAGSAQAATLLDRLIGSWSGSGQIRYDDGQSEGVRCSAYYTGGNDRLRLAIRCRSDSTEVEIRGLLTRQGEKLGGTWEERTFNASGEASGRLTADRMSVSITGGGFSGSMTVAYAGSRQVVTISTQGIEMRSVNVTLAKR